MEIKNDITPEQMVAQFKAIASRFDVALLNTKHEIGKRSMDFFKSSFDIQGFPMSSDKWAKRRHEKSWPILNKTGALVDSIGYDLKEGGGLVVSTDESQFQPGRHDGDSNSYAAFHNDPTGTHRINQYSDDPQIQRKFIGNSPQLEQEIEGILSLMMQNLIK